VHAHHHNPSISKPTGRFLDDSGSIARPELLNTAIIYRLIHQECSPPPFFLFFIKCIYSNFELLGLLADHIFKYLYFYSFQGIFCGDTTFFFEMRTTSQMIF